MIIPIRNQPITFAPVEAETAFCGDTSGYCQLARLNDRYCFQLKQTSCLPQLLCNNDFSVFGTDFVAPYGEFDTEIEFDEFASDHMTWYWDEYGHQACTFGIGAHFGGIIQFNLNSYAQSADCTYVLSFEVSGYETPEGEPVDGDLVVTLPDGNTHIVTANGAYSFSTQAGSEFHFTPGVDGAWCIDNITYRCAGTCWTINSQSDVALSGSGIRKITTGTPVSVTEQTGTLTAGKYYQLYVKTEGSTQGSIEFFLGTVSIGTTDENGIFTLSGVSDGTDFSFVMDSDFDGCVMYVQIYQLQKDYTLKLKNAADDTVILDMTSSLLYGEEIKAGTRGDLLQACISFGEDMLGDLIPDFVNNTVCLYLEIESPADNDVVTSGGFLITNNTALSDDWGATGTLQAEAIQGQAILSGGTGYFIQDLQGAGFVQGNTYYVAFDLLCLNHGDTDPDFDSFTASLGSDEGTGAGGAMVWDSTNFPTQAGHYIYKVTAGTDGNGIAFYFTNADGLEKICIDNISIRDTPCAHEVLQSNCIKYANENHGVIGWEGSKLITACNEEGSSMGFDWSTGFKLQSRLFMDITNPRYSSKEDETYLQSNGVRKRVYADTSKILDLRIGAVDELTHDYIRTMFKCDVLFIDSGYTLSDQYICLEAEYAPEWDAKGRLSLAGATTEVQKFDNTIFNTNCR